MKHKRPKKLFRTIILTLICAAFAFMFLMPTVLTITNSFMEESEISSNYGKIFSAFTQNGKTFVSEKVNLKFIPDEVSFSQYITALIKSPDYLFKFWNSVILVVPIVILQVITAALAAYGFTRWRGKFRSFMFFFYVILMLMPYQVTLVPNYLVSGWLGVLNTRWAIIFPGMFAPFSVFLLTKFMRRIPVSLIEAAKLDGAGEWQIFTKICIPQCRSALYSIAILVFVDYWNMVEQPIILLPNADLQPLSVYLSTINSGEVGVAFAVATVYMIPTLLLFLHGEEYLVEGIAHQGSVKG
jgi:multiple sugar transport system permease protein